jgi:hypothetical protein
VDEPDGGTDGGGTDRGGTDGGGTDGGPDAGPTDGGTDSRPTRLSFVSPAQSVEAGQCSEPVVLESQSSAGSPTPVASATTLAMGAQPSTGFGLYADSSCLVSLSTNQVRLAAGSSRATFIRPRWRR